MQQVIAKIMVFCLLVISVHVGSETEHLPIHSPDSVSQTQVVAVVMNSDEDTPSDEKQMNSECSICHAVHVLVILAPEAISFSLYSSRQYDGREQNMLPSPLDDIAHPPIILI